jgi:hypothetical protein
MNEEAKFNWFEIEGESKNELKFSTDRTYTISEINEQLKNKNKKVFNGIFVYTVHKNSCFIRVILSSVTNDERYKLESKGFNYNLNDINNQYKVLKDKHDDVEFTSYQKDILEFETNTIDFKNLNKGNVVLKSFGIIE